MIRRCIVVFSTVLACACALGLVRRHPPADLHRVRHVTLHVTWVGLRTPHSVERWRRNIGALAEALVRRGFIVTDDDKHADATFIGNLDSVIVVDAPQEPRYYFSFEMTSKALAVSWRTSFNTLDLSAPNQAEEQGIAKGVDRMFDEWKRSAVRAGVMTSAEAGRLRRIPQDPTPTPQRPGPDRVPGFVFPWFTDLGCPGETCSFGTWTACTDIDVRDTTGSEAPVGWRLGKGDRFEVFAGFLRTLEPGEVRVTREVRQGSRALQRVYRAGDTLHLLGQLSGSRFAAIHNDRPVIVEAFWQPKTAGSLPAAGELIRSDVSERWRLVSLDKQSGWIAEDARVRKPNDPPCPTTRSPR